MADSQYKTGEYLVDNEPGTMQQLEGRFAFINQLDLHNGGDDCNSTHHMYHLNGREKQYQKFLFYKYFFANEKPLIVTEGKTDILYIRAALMNLHERYPNLVQLCPDGKYDFKISFFRRSKRFRQLFGMSMDGADAIQQIYDFYVGAGALPKYYKHFMNYQKSTPANPVILVFDNELNNKSKPLCKFINKTTSSAERERFKDIIGKDLTASIIHGANLFLATHQLVDGKQECEIEDLFDQETRSTIIEGRELSLDNDYDRKKCYGKDEFSKYILSHYKTIDFTRFTTLLDNMEAIISDYREHD